jgi:hypothetical protein
MDVSKQPRHPEPAFRGEDESFIATATVVVTPCPPEAHAYLEVVAPATLPEVRSLILSPVFVLSCMNI